MACWYHLCLPPTWYESLRKDDLWGVRHGTYSSVSFVSVQLCGSPQWKDYCVCQRTNHIVLIHLVIRLFNINIKGDSFRLDKNKLFALWNLFYIFSYTFVDLSRKRTDSVADKENWLCYLELPSVLVLVHSILSFV